MTSLLAFILALCLRLFADKETEVEVDVPTKVVTIEKDVSVK